METIMLIPHDLSEAIRLSSEALRQNSAGELPLYDRRRIWKAFGEREKDSSGSPTGAGWQRRCYLAVLCVQHVLPLWQSVYMSDERPQQMLKITDQLMQSAYDSDKALQEQQSFFDELGDAANENISAACVGYASVQAVTVATVDLDDDNFDPVETDHDLDAYQWDTSYYASMAAAGGDIFVEGSNVERSVAFWNWFLNQAVPTAYSST
jgi:hypothetical protein